MEGFNAGIIVWVSLTAKRMQDFFPGQAVFKCLARILASKVTMQNDSFCIPHVQAGILYRFHCQFRRHRCAIGITDDFTAAQIHDRRQISPSFFLHMDVGNICAPFWLMVSVSKSRFKIFTLLSGTLPWLARWLYFLTTTEHSPCSAICLCTRLTLQGVPLSFSMRHILTATYLCF